MEKEKIQEHDELCQRFKATLPKGEWTDEPNRIEWRHKGLACLMVRHEHHYHWCGYVGVPPGHPAHGKDYDSVNVNVDVHGGLTYARACEELVCHVPEPGESENTWWLGFDCAHYEDLSPFDLRNGPRPRATYRNVEYVKREVNRLADQLASKS